MGTVSPTLTPVYRNGWLETSSIYRNGNGKKARNTSGKFAPQSEVPRKVRLVNLTDYAWQWLATVAWRVQMIPSPFRPIT